MKFGVAAGALTPWLAAAEAIIEGVLQERTVVVVLDSHPAQVVLQAGILREHLFELSLELFDIPEESCLPAAALFLSAESALDVFDLLPEF